MTLTILLPLGTRSLLLFLENGVAVLVVAVAVGDCLCLHVDAAEDHPFTAMTCLPLVELECRVAEHLPVSEPKEGDQVEEHLAVQELNAEEGDPVCKSLQFGIPMLPLCKKLPLPVWKAMTMMLEKNRGVSPAVAENLEMTALLLACTRSPHLVTVTTKKRKWLA